MRFGAENLCVAEKPFYAIWERCFVYRDSSEKEGGIWNRTIKMVVVVGIFFIVLALVYSGPGLQYVEYLYEK